MSDTAIESVTETGPSTGKDVTQPINVLSLMQHAAQDALNTGPRPAAYQPRLRTETLTRPPLAYSSANVTKLEGFEVHGAAVAPAVTAIDAMHAALASVIDARAKSDRDPELGTEASRVLKVATYADKLMDGAVRKVDAASQHVQSQIKATQAELNKAVTSGTHTALATEIRAHAKAQKAPMQFVSELIAAGDAQSVSAVLGAPAYLSGLTEQMRVALTRSWNERQQPALSAKLALLEATAERLDRAGAAFIVNVEKAMGVRYDTVKRLRDAQSAASFG